VAELVRLAAGTEAAGGGEERERCNQGTERDAGRLEAGGVGNRSGAEHGQADHVREPRRP
jgi:hypothetical protein